MLFKIIRPVLGQTILLLNFLTPPRRQKRSPAAQAAVVQSASGLALYQFAACPFCVKTRRSLRRLNVPVVLRDARNDAEHRQTLLEQGGKVKVPCLRIEENGEVRWMYESKVIIDYLQRRFANA